MCSSDLNIQSENENSFSNIFDYEESKRPAIVESSISRKITLGDICVKGYEDVNGKEIEATIESIQQEMGIIQWDNFETKHKKYPSSLDGLSYLLLMNHNVELHIKACQEACYWMDQPINISTQHLPSEILEFKDLCTDIFTSEKPMDLSDKNWRLLTNANGMDAYNDLSIDIFKKD